VNFHPTNATAKLNDASDKIAAVMRAAVLALPH
jgi:hypothetical protein